MKEVERITGKSPMQLQHEKVVKVREDVDKLQANSQQVCETGDRPIDPRTHGNGDCCARRVLTSRLCAVVPNKLKWPSPQSY
jgi:hypothetical protein